MTENGLYVIYAPRRPGCDGEPLAKALATRSVTPVTSPSAAFGRLLNGKVAAIFPRLSSMADKITIEDTMLDDVRSVAQALARYGIEPVVEVVDVEPGEADNARGVVLMRDPWDAEYLAPGGRHHGLRLAALPA